MTKKLKKVLSGLLAFSMLATPVLNVNAEVIENVSTEETETLYGDINSDGFVNNSDVDILKKAILGVGSLTEKEFLSADLNGDGKLNSLDLTKISKLVKEKRNLRVIEDCDDLVDLEKINSHIYTYGRFEYYLNSHKTEYIDGELISLAKPYFYLNGIKHYMPTALENGIITLDEIPVAENLGLLPYPYLDLKAIKVIPPADGAIKQPLVEYLYNDGKYDYFFYNLDSYIYTIEMYGKQYTLREVIDNQLLTPGELVALGLYDYNTPAPLENIETIEIHDPYYDSNYGPYNFRYFQRVFGEALQLIYQDEEHNYFLSNLRGRYIYVTINEVLFSLKEVIENEILTIDELIDAGLHVYTYNYIPGYRLWSE